MLTFVMVLVVVGKSSAVGHGMSREWWVVGLLCVTFHASHFAIPTYHTMERLQNNYRTKKLAIRNAVPMKLVGGFFLLVNFGTSGVNAQSRGFQGKDDGFE